MGGRELGRSGTAGVDLREGPASLLGITIRRSFSVGRLYVLIGIGTMLLWEVLLAFASPAAFISVIPYLIPIFGFNGALGGVMVYTNDRVKGVYEYLIAYGVSPRRIAANILLAGLVLLAVVLAIVLSAGLGLYAAGGGAFTWTALQPLVLYSIPMAFATALFATTVGMFWTSLTSPRAGMNSPIGLIPIVGIAPPAAVLVLSSAIRGVPFEAIAGGAVALIAISVVVLLSQMDRLMPRERLLSPA